MVHMRGVDLVLLVTKWDPPESCVSKVMVVLNFPLVMGLTKFGLHGLHQRGFHYNFRVFMNQATKLCTDTGGVLGFLVPKWLPPKSCWEKVMIFFKNFRVYSVLCIVAFWGTPKEF